MTTVLGCGAATITARAAERVARVRLVATAAVMLALFAVTINWGVASRDDLLWKHELIASFFRPEGFAFEPTARRQAVAERDAVLTRVLSATGRRRPPQARRPDHRGLTARRPHAGLRVSRETTPFLSRSCRPDA